MSRTVHHTPYKHRQGRWPWYVVPGPVTSHELYDLRYSTQELRRAYLQGRRPIPDRRRHRFAVYSYPRSFNVTAIGEWARIERRRRRRRDRWVLDDARRAFNAGARPEGEGEGEGEAWEAVADLDMLVSVERRDAAWNAC